MPGGGKKSGAIVIRPIARGESLPTKVVLGTFDELNYHAPEEEITQHLKVEVKPWRLPPKSRWRDRRHDRRNGGCDEGKAWGGKKDFVDEPVVNPHRKRNPNNVEEEEDVDNRKKKTTKAGHKVEKQKWVGGSGADGRDEKLEVNILDIAKPAKPRGLAKGYEVVTARQVIALEDDRWDWGTATATEDRELLGGEEWETVEDEAAIQESYA